MIQGIKKKEYRTPSKWIETRLSDKHYDFIKVNKGDYVIDLGKIIQKGNL